MDSSRTKTPQAAALGHHADELARALVGLIRPLLAEVLADALAEVAPPDNDRPPLSARLLTISEACDALGVSKPTLSRLRAKGLPTLMVGDSPRFDLDEAKAWLRAQRGDQ